MTTTQQIEAGNTLIFGAPGSGMSAAIDFPPDDLRSALSNLKKV